MSIAGLLFALLLTLFILAWVIMPLVGRKDSNSEELPPDKQCERLLTYYERVLRNIRDLDEDHALGKIDEGEYTREREEWALRGTQVLEALDVLGGQGEAEAEAETSKLDAPASVTADQAADDAIEAAIQRYRQRNPQ